MSKTATSVSRLTLHYAKMIHTTVPPYPSRERRRTLRAGRYRRRTVGDSDHLQIPSANSEPEYDLSHHAGPPSPFPLSADADHEATETTPLLLSPRLPPGGISGRRRAVSITSTLHSTTSVAPSFAHTVLSALHPERDCDLDPDVESDRNDDSDGHDYLDSPTPRITSEEQARLFAAGLSSPRAGRRATPDGRWRRYFRPMARRAYYSALFHLLVLNFPFALAAWLYLFVFTLVRLSLAYHLLPYQLTIYLFRRLALPHLWRCHWGPCCVSSTS